MQVVQCCHVAVYQARHDQFKSVEEPPCQRCNIFISGVWMLSKRACLDATFMKIDLIGVPDPRAPQSRLTAPDTQLQKTQGGLGVVHQKTASVHV